MRNSLNPYLVILLLAFPSFGLADSPNAGTEEVCVLETSMGTMVFRFFEDAAPATVANFKELGREGFYDGLPFYRVVAGHVIQAGDGGENERPTVPGEFGAHAHITGAVGLARDDDPDSGSTEFYICLAPRPHLDGRYAVFGLLVEGFDVLEKIGNVPVVEQYIGESKIAFHQPETPVVISTVSLERRSLGEALPTTSDSSGGSS